VNATTAVLPVLAFLAISVEKLRCGMPSFAWRVQISSRTARRAEPRFRRAYVRTAMPVTVDDRERALVLNLVAHGLSPSVRRLTVADVLIEDSEGGVALAVERKTAADLTASLVDGRFAEQRARLIEAYGHDRVAYVIEGELQGTPAAERGAILSLQLRDRVMLLRTTDVSETGELVRKLAALADEGRLEYRAAPPAALARVRRAPTDTPRSALASFLSLLPGVSAAMATSVVALFSGPSELCAALREDPEACERAIKDCKAPGGRRVGPAAAARVRAAFSAPT
jgi:ERCC4-type nuclease